MKDREVLIGRDAERARLLATLDRARSGAGSLVLLAGEAGVGKSRLAREVASEADALVLTGAAHHGGTPPYGPVVAALRAFLRAHPGGLDDCGPLGRHLALLLPELGEAAPGSDRATLLEAVHCALARVAANRHALVLLDDLQWSDQATLELLGALATPLADLPILIVAAYRSDGLPRDHGVRRLRHELRRAGRLDELALEPLDARGTADLLGQVLGTRPSPGLARVVHDRTQGLPFFVEELGAALRLRGALGPGGHGLELLADDEVIVPDTVREAVLVTTAELSAEGRMAAETAAVAGVRFDLELVASLSDHAGLAELADRGLVREDGAGGGAFRHALTREALYADVPWLRRRALHRALADALEAAGGPSREIAGHWVAARDPERARAALVRSAAESEAVHAYRDAAEAGRTALELWPEAGDDERRHEALARFAHCAEVAGELAEAARAWRELAAIRAAGGDQRGTAESHRRLAAVHDLRGDRQAAFAARSAAADAFVASGLPAEAAVERLALANQRRLSARHGEAIGLARAARAEADAAGRVDLRARALGLEGMAIAKRGDQAAGVQIVRTALGLALEHGLTAVAAELYQRLSVALYDASDYRRAHEALDTALELCRTDGDAGTEIACVTCLAYVLRERGEWARAAELCHELLASGTAVFVAEGLLGAIHAAQGRLASARRLLSSSLAASTRVEHYNMRVDATLGLARVALAEGAEDEARERCRALLAAWQATDDHHYATNALRWSAAFLATHGHLREARACVQALSRIASDTGYPDALAALGHAIAETALAEGDAATAAEQLARAVEHLRGLDVPYQLAELELRAGVALKAAGEREPALERLSTAYRIARRLGARPLAAEAAREVAALGESVARRLGTRAAADAGNAGLSARELQVLRLVAAGRTNVEIARELFLSPRTVDMHVRNILRKLDCRSRVEAAGRAGDLGLLVPPAGGSSVSGARR